MKKIFKYLLFFSLSILLFAVCPKTNFTYATENTSEDRTVFVVQSEFIANTDNGIYIYDNSDQALKLLSSTASQSVSYPIAQCKDLCSLNNNIYLLTSSGVIVFDTQTATTSTIEIANLQSYHTKITVSLVGSNEIICVYPLDTANNQTVLYGINQGAGYQFYTIEFTQNQFNQTTNISLLSFVEYNNLTYLLKAYGQSITSYPINTMGDNLVLSTATTLVLSDTIASNYIVSLAPLYLTNDTNIVIAYQNKTDVYGFDGSSITLKYSVTHRYQDNIFNCIDMAVNGNTIALLADNCYYTSTLNQTLTIDFKMSNPICNINYRDAKDFEYYTTIAQSKLITTLDSNQTTILPIGSNVVEIADVELSDGTSLKGYKYVMYTEYNLNGNQYVGINKFGYIITDNDCLVKVNQQASQTTIKVFANSKLYKYPSVVVNTENEQNNVIKYISQNVPVKVLCYINEYANEYGQTTTNYALVEVNGDVGFIDTKAILSTDKRIILAIPNAKLLSNTNVYEYADTASNILHRLSDTTRVKIIDSRDSKGFIKIAYNDTEGNYFEGYIKAYNVKADSYTTLQIIGTVLVILNVAFLVILIITKRKVVR